MRPADGAEYWSRVAETWLARRGAVALRRYSDAVNRGLLERWLPSGTNDLLKTDLFDEVVGEGVVGVLSRRAVSVTAIDVSPVLVERSRARFPTLEGVVADVRALPFPDASFDVVVSLSTLDHFISRDEIGRALLELARVLKPGGTMIVTLDNAANPLVAVRNMLPGSLLRRLGLVPYELGKTLGPRGLRDAVRASGLVEEEDAVFMHVPRLLVRAGFRGRALGVAERLGHLPTRSWSGQFVAVRARKPYGAGARMLDRRPPSIRHFLARALSATVYRRLSLLALRLEALPPIIEAELSLEFAFAGSPDLEALAALRSDLSELAPARMARGDRCFVARHEGRIVFARWVTREARIDFLGSTLALASDEIYLFDAWTDPAARGLHVATAAGAVLYHLLAEEGIRVALRAIWPENEGGIRNAKRDGFTRIGTVGVVGRGPLRYRFDRRCREY